MDPQNNLLSCGQTQPLSPDDATLPPVSSRTPPWLTRLLLLPQKQGDENHESEEKTDKLQISETFFCSFPQFLKIAFFVTAAVIGAAPSVRILKDRTYSYLSTYSHYTYSDLRSSK